MRVYTLLAMDFKKFFSKRLRTARTEKGLTQSRLAEMCGLPPNAVTKYETEVAVPSVETLKKLAEALGVSTDYFVFDHAKMEGIPKVKDAELYERYFILETLGDEERGAVLTVLNALIAKQRLREVMEAPDKVPPSTAGRVNSKEATA